METKIEIHGIKDALAMHDPQKVLNAARSAINKIATQTRTYASRIIREEFNIPASKLNQFLRVTARAGGTNIEAVIEGRGMGLPLSYFSPRQVGVQVSKRTGFRYTRKAASMGGGRRHGGAVTVEIRRGKRKVVEEDPKAFLTILKSGHIAVMQRTGKARLPVRQLLGPGVGGLFGSRLFLPKITQFVNDKFGPIFQHEMEWRLRK